MSDSIRITFSNAEQTAQSLLQEAQTLYDTVRQIHRAATVLQNSRFEGSFRYSFEVRYGAAAQDLQYLSDRSDQAGRDLHTAVELYRALDAECAALFTSQSGSGWGIDQGGYGIPDYVVDYVHEHVGQDYSYWAAAGHFDTLTGKMLFPYPGGLAERLFEKGAIKLVGQLGAMTPDEQSFQALLGAIRSPWFGSAVIIGGGVASGFGDWLVDGDYSGEALATQLISGGIQGAIGLTPVGRGILVADAAVQLFGHGASQIIEDNALWLAGGDSVRAQEIMDTADRFQVALDAVDLDSRIDGVVDAALHGDVNGIVDELKTGLWGVENVVGEGALLGQQTVEGIAEQIADNTQIDETFNALADGAGEAVDDMLGFFGL